MSLNNRQLVLFDQSGNPLLGQQVATSSIPVVLASDQTAIPVTDNGGSLTVDGTVTATQGTAAALAAAWPVKITDGTSIVEVMPASTIPTVSDPAFVVIISPNQVAIPVTTAPVASTPGVATGDPTLATTAKSTVRRTTYTEQAANFTGSVISSSAADAAAGTGARTLRIYWMNALGTSSGTEDVTLNGTTAVNLVTSTKCYIEKIEVLTAGSGGVAAGTLTLKAGLNNTGTTVGTIALGDTSTYWAHHYVLSGKTCYVTGALAGSSSTVAGNGSVYMIAALTIGGTGVEKQISDFFTLFGQSSQITRNYGSALKVAGPARVLMYVTPVSGTSVVYRGSFDYYDQ